MADENQMERGGGAGAKSEEEIGSEATHARMAGEDLSAAAAAMVGEYPNRAKEVWEDAKHRARTFQEDSEQYIRENPTKTVFTALGIGFVLGLIFRR